jgi:hypothetical protein
MPIDLFNKISFSYTTKKIGIGCALSTVIHLEPLPDHISTMIQYLESLMICGQLISSGYSLESLLIIYSPEAV